MFLSRPLAQLQKGQFRITHRNWRGRKGLGGGGGGGHLALQFSRKVSKIELKIKFFKSFAPTLLKIKASVAT